MKAKVSPQTSYIASLLRSPTGKMGALALDTYGLWLIMVAASV